MEHVVRIDLEGRQIILIPTAHVSKESVDLVKQVVDEEQPESICIELDEGRYQSILNPRQWENTDIVQIIKSKRVGFMLANLALSAYQKKIAKKLDTAVGQEMLQGIASAKETGAQLVLADRSIQTTFLRIWRKLGMMEKCKLLFTLIFSTDEEAEITDQELQQLLQQDMLESMLADIHKQFPKIGHILISERDQHLAAKIKEAPGEKVVAVLGGAHVPGVREELFKEQDMAEITSVPALKKGSRIKGWIIPAIIIVLVLYGFFTNVDTGMRQLSSWVIWNGTLAALFTALALGHPLTVLTAFVVAPISSLNPLLACGWFAGLMEAAIRKPAVKDLNSIPDDILTARGFFRNRFLRILLIVIMANIGSTIGTLVAGVNIIQTIF